MIRRRKLTIAIAATLAGGAIALAGCGDDDSSSGDDTTVVETVTEATSTAAAPATTAATTTSSSGDLAAGLSIPSNATSESTGEDGTHYYWSTSDSYSTVVSDVQSSAESAGWSVTSSGGGGGDDEGEGGGGFSASKDGAYLDLEAGGDGTTYVDLCVWPSEPSNDDCGDDQDDDG